MNKNLKLAIFTLFVFVAIACEKESEVPDPRVDFLISHTQAEINDTITFFNESDADYTVIWPGDSGRVFVAPDSDQNGKAIPANSKDIKYIYTSPGTYTITMVASNKIAEERFVHSEPIHEQIEIVAGGNDMFSFSFEGLTDTDRNPVVGGNFGTIKNNVIKIGKVYDEQDEEIDDKSIPYASDIKNLVPTFIVSDFAAVYVNGVEQISGSTANDFSEPVIYNVVAHNGEVNTYTVIVEQKEPKTYARIKEFGLLDLTDMIEIDSDVDTISLSVPEGTDVTALTALFEKTAYSIVTVDGVRQWSNETATDFTNPVEYKVVSEDGSKEKIYTVSVSNPAR